MQGGDARPRERGDDDTPLFELDAVDKRYGSYHALKAVTLTAPRGTVGLLGPNGAGKSTLLRALLGLLPFEGRARVLGWDPQTPEGATAIRDRVGYMPERDSELPGTTAVEYCAYAGELSGLPPAEAMSRAHAILEFVGLGDKRYQKVAGYSTGMKQRVKLAQALVHDPELLFLDEPTNGLDPTGRAEMLALIRSLPERTGCSIVLSSHVLPDVEATCERALLLDAGRVEYWGTVEALRNEDARNVLEVRVKERPEAMRAALEKRGFTVEEEGPLLTVRDAAAAVVFEIAEAEGLQVRHLQPRKLSLEQAFVRVVERARRSDGAAGASDGKAATRDGKAARDGKTARDGKAAAR